MVHVCEGRSVKAIDISLGKCMTQGRSVKAIDISVYDAIGMCIPFNIVNVLKDTSYLVVRKVSNIMTNVNWVKKLPMLHTQC